jgi:hypothetical protein
VFRQRVVVPLPVRAVYPERIARVVIRHDVIVPGIEGPASAPHRRIWERMHKCLSGFDAERLTSRLNVRHYALGVA